MPLRGTSCSDHDEKMKLFCETDRQLVCIICRDDEKRPGHEFKPIKEAESYKKVHGLGGLTVLQISYKRTRKSYYFP
ncbi:zinc-binding protein A33-like [Arapaima gigas]